MDEDKMGALISSPNQESPPPEPKSGNATPFSPALSMPPRRRLSPPLPLPILSPSFHRKKYRRLQLEHQRSCHLRSLVTSLTHSHEQISLTHEENRSRVLALSRLFPNLSLLLHFSAEQGLLREITMASVLGVGAVATAFKYAWVLPGFSSSLLGDVYRKVLKENGSIFKESGKVQL